MDREGGNKEKITKCREWISLHFLILSPFPLHFLILSPFSHSPAARLAQVVQPWIEIKQKCLKCKYWAISGSVDLPSYDIQKAFEFEEGPWKAGWGWSITLSWFPLNLWDRKERIKRSILFEPWNLSSILNFLHLSPDHSNWIYTRKKKIFFSQETQTATLSLLHGCPIIQKITILFGRA